MKVISILFFLSFLVIIGCSPLTLKPSDFSWPVENELVVENNGVVLVKQYNFSFNAKRLLYVETGDSVNVGNVKLRMIRDALGYYYITAEKFKNVYLFEQIEGSLGLADKIPVSKNGLVSPAFNQRPPFIELISGQNESILLTKDGVEEGEKK